MSSKNVTTDVVSVDEQAFEKHEDAEVDEDGFSRWPWYDEQVTYYQIRYEFSNTIGGDTPLPMNCGNDDMQRYCIGQDQCPYSIWGVSPSQIRCTTN